MAPGYGYDVVVACWLLDGCVSFVLNRTAPFGTGAMFATGQSVIYATPNPRLSYT
jgi:hypothetical protein